MPIPIKRDVLTSKLREAKKNKGVPEYVVAFQAEIERSRLSMIKNGFIVPSEEEQLALSKALSDILEEDITPANLFSELHNGNY